MDNVDMVYMDGEGGRGILKTLFPLIRFFCDLAVRLQIQKGSTVSQQMVT
jgi:hypothetical protein